MISKAYLPHLLLLATTVVAGLNYSISKILMPEFILPFGIVFIRCVVAVVFFSVVYMFSPKEKIDTKDILKIGLASALGIACNQLLFIEGLNMTTPINASLMMTSSPIIVFLVSAIILKEKITWVKIVGIALAASGAISLLLHSFSMEAHSILVGDIFIILNACCWALFLVVIKPLVVRYRTTTIIPFLFIFGLIMVIPFGIGDFRAINFEHFTSKAWLALGFVIVFATLFAYYFNIYVLKFIDPSIAGIYIYLQPLLATVFSIFLGKDYLTFEKVLFSLFIFSGVYLVSRKASYKPSESILK